MNILSVYIMLCVAVGASQVGHDTFIADDLWDLEVQDWCDTYLVDMNCADILIPIEDSHDITL